MSLSFATLNIFEGGKAPVYTNGLMKIIVLEWSAQLHRTFIWRSTKVRDAIARTIKAHARLISHI